MEKGVKAWVGSVGGSDLYREAKVEKVREGQIHNIRFCDWLTAENEQTINLFYKTYGEEFKNKPMTINRFGIDILDKFDFVKDMDRKSLCLKYGIPDGTINVACGYNSSPEHQHLSIVESIKQMDKKLREKCCFVFPLTYGWGTDDYIDMLDRQLSEDNIKHVFLRRFLSATEMAEYISLCNIMIHVQTTDQMSSTMLAHMYNGNIVIAGDWLPYRSLEEQGVFFLTINKLEDLERKLDYSIRNIEDYHLRCKGNREIIYKMSSWESAAKNWYKVYSDCLKKKEIYVRG